MLRFFFVGFGVYFYCFFGNLYTTQPVTLNCVFSKGCCVRSVPLFSIFLSRLQLFVCFIDGNYHFYCQVGQGVYLHWNPSQYNCGRTPCYPPWEDEGPEHSLLQLSLSAVLRVESCFPCFLLFCMRFRRVGFPLMRTTNLGFNSNLPRTFIITFLAFCVCGRGRTTNLLFQAQAVNFTPLEPHFSQKKSKGGGNFWSFRSTNANLTQGLTRLGQSGVHAKQARNSLFGSNALFRATRIFWLIVSKSYIFIHLAPHFSKIFFFPSQTSLDSVIFFSLFQPLWGGGFKTVWDDCPTTVNFYCSARFSDEFSHVNWGNTKIFFAKNETSHPKECGSIMWAYFHGKEGHKPYRHIWCYFSQTISNMIFFPRWTSN